MQLYLDMDGVLADFDKRAQDVLGMPSRQEDNLKYVIETRARTTLIIAYSEDFK